MIASLVAYKNLSGASAVVGYLANEDHMVIQFDDGSIYRYDVMSVGEQNIEAMKTLADRGRGLHTFIERFVKDNYALRLK